MPGQAGGLAANWCHAPNLQMLLLQALQAHPMISWNPWNQTPWAQGIHLRGTSTHRQLCHLMGNLRSLGWQPRPALRHLMHFHRKVCPREPLQARPHSADHAFAVRIESAWNWWGCCGAPHWYLLELRSAPFQRHSRGRWISAPWPIPGSCLVAILSQYQQFYLDTQPQCRIAFVAPLQLQRFPKSARLLVPLEEATAHPPATASKGTRDLLQPASTMGTRMDNTCN